MPRRVPGWRALWALVGTAGVLAWAAPALAAVEPALYVDPPAAAPGQPVTLFSAADYVVCFSVATPDQVLEDRPVFLGSGGTPVTSPDDPGLTPVAGRWSEADGALQFRLTVPAVEPGSYRVFVACDGGSLDASTPILRVLAAAPATDALTPTQKTGRSGRLWWIPAGAGLLALAASLSRSTRTGAHRDDPERRRTAGGPEIGEGTEGDDDERS